MMRDTLMLSLALTAALFLLPLRMRTQPPPSPPGAPEPQAQPEAFAAAPSDKERLLRVLQGEETMEMDLGTYLLGVLRAEMPASFPLEALKAQAVAARTYTMRHLQGEPRHETADICTDPACCQAYRGAEEAWAAWGAQAAEYEEKLRLAVTATDGEALYYAQEPILAVFHAASAGLTRPSGQVWAEDLPYLQPVPSAEDGDSIPNYESVETFSADEVKAAFLAACPEADFSTPLEQWFSDPVTDAAGSVDTLTVGGQRLRGTKVRSVLGLRSACFTWEVGEGGFTFRVRGYGHGVGLSQYGAAAMAEAGEDYRAILSHYYTGAVLQ